MRFFNSAALFGASLFASACARPQGGPNTVAQNNPNARTMAPNGTWFIVPIDTAIVQKSVPYPLLPVPTSDKSLFPKGFPAGKHPVVVSNTYNNDIRMSALQIKSLMSGSLYVPFVDRLKDGKTPFQYPIFTLIGGTNGQFLQAVVPSIVGSLEGTVVHMGEFDPDYAPWKPIAPGEYSAQGKYSVVPNPVSGPGVVESLYDMDFFTTKAPLYTAHTFHALINQAVIQYNTLCFRNPYYFNETFAYPLMRTGKVTLYEPPLPAGYKGEYTGVGGYSAQSENIGYNPEECSAAAKNVDPESLK